jgi:aspartyl-tRNA(Asn)/glutamyl-tRNA(Gln) amidotransferase subunit C
MDAKTVDHIALLARLDLTESDRELFARQLAAILGYIEKLKELPVEGVRPLAYAVDAQNVFRADAPRPCLTPDEALRSAPDRQDDFFRVPKVIE